MEPGVYFARLAGSQYAPIKIGFSTDPIKRLSALCNYHKKDYEIIAHVPGDGDLERHFHARFEQSSIGNEFFLPSTGLSKLIDKYKLTPVLRKKYETRSPKHSRRKSPRLVMTPERVKLVGDHLNGRNGKKQLSGPKIAKKLGVSTASIYGYWKQSGPGKFVRRQPKA